MRSEGPRRIYAVDPEGVREVREYWERFWSQALAGFKAVADTEAEQRAGIGRMPEDALARTGTCAALAGIALASVWNYALSSKFVWGRFR